jgi:tetratricopeptide (TPR) repeat protein
LGRLEEAEAELSETLRVAREVGNPAQLRLTLAALGRLRQAQGQPEEARAAYQEAIAVVEGVAATLSDATLREALLASPQVAALRASAF